MGWTTMSPKPLRLGDSMSLIHRNKSLTANLLDLMLVIGVSCIAGSILFLVIAAMLNPQNIFTGFSLMFPVFITGIIIIWVASKLSEILE